MIAASLMIFLSLGALTACSSQTANNLARAKKDNQIIWGVRPDTKLFGLTNIKTGKIEGFEIDLATAITKQVLGKKSKAVFRPITEKTRITLLHNGSLDAVISTMTITKERMKVVDFSDVYFAANESMIVKKTSKIRTVADLNHKGVVVIAIKGTDVPNQVAKLAPKASVKQFDDYGSAFNALKAGQGDVMIDDDGILAGLIADSPQFTLTKASLAQEPYGIGVEKGQDDLRQAINKALKSLRANGTYDKLVRKWFGKVSGFDVKEAESQKVKIQ
ncbi:transporter substrate-binding domain-containing protein [Lactobacillus equicursoris]|uniref:transporter substrate-binding domain-containing protein n=1 Tax=Lactobacillus equicursoris TaxID=420645 RepID=UPI0039967A0B